MNSYDHYAKARELAKLLARDGDNSLSDEVLEAMVVGATGTEIFMLLREAVRKSMAHGRLLADTEQLARSLLVHLEEALQ